MTVADVAPTGSHPDDRTVPIQPLRFAADVAVAGVHELAGAVRAVIDAADERQEHGLIEHIEERLGLPVTTDAVDAAGHASNAAGPFVLCYDGSDDAKHAIEHAGALFGGKPALVVTVWRPTVAMGGLAVAGEAAGMIDFFELDQAAAEHANRVADEGVRIVQESGLVAEAVVARATGPVWRTILDVAARHDAATIVMGSRGLTGLRSVLLGSVSTAVLHHADRPALIIPRPAARV